MSSENIVNSFLLYVDSERSRNANSTGTNLIVPLNESGMQCEDGQFMRLSLVNFSSFRNYPTININNNTFQIRLARGGGPAPGFAPQDIAITPQNYKNLNDIAIDFSTQAAAEILRWYVGAPPSAINGVVVVAGSVLPAGTTGATGTGNNIYQAIFETQIGGVATPHTIANPNDLLVQFLVSKGDCWAIMGGNRERDPANTTANGMVVVLGPSFAPAIVLNANQFAIVGRYEMQQYTNDYVYLRTNIQSSNIQTPSFNAQDTDVGPGRVEGSRILARIPSYNTFNYFVTNTQREFFLNLGQRSIPELTLNLTDSAGRQLPFAPGQDVLGNMSFSCVIRVEIIEKWDQSHMAQFPRFQNPVPARFTTQPIDRPDGGVDGFN